MRMEILNNRELAITFWLIACLVYLLASKKMGAVRKAYRRLLSVFFGRHNLSVLTLMLLYMVLIVYALSNVNLWNVDQIKNTVFWCASVGYLSLFKLESIKKNKSFFFYSVINNLKLLAIIQFVVNVYTFPFLVEIAMVPFLVIIGAMTAITDKDKKYIQVKRLLDALLLAFGFIVICFTIYMLATRLGEITNEKTLYDFIIPPLLTLLYLPFIFFMMVYSTYETIYIRLKYAINDRKLRILAKIYAIVVFNIRLSLIERWWSHVAREKVKSHKELIDSLKHIFKVRNAEKSPIEIPASEGWSPYKAKNFLKNEGIETGHYDKIIDEWNACSSMIELGEGLIPDNIAYYINGTESTAKTLKLILNVNDSKRSTLAQKKFLTICNALIRASLNRRLSNSMKSAILNGKEYNELHENKRVSVHNNKWSKHTWGGYDIKFIVSSI
jgi:hypothetical protein